MTSTHKHEKGAAARITAVVGSWPDVKVGPHDFGAIGFTLGRRQLGHLHGDEIAEIPFPRRTRDELIATGRAQPHRYRPDSGWITFPIQTEEDVEQAIELFQLAYEQARAHGRARQAPAPARDTTARKHRFGHDNMNPLSGIARPGDPAKRRLGTGAGQTAFAASARGLIATRGDRRPDATALTVADPEEAA